MNSSVYFEQNAEASLTIKGQWVLPNHADLKRAGAELDRLVKQSSRSESRIDLSGLQQLDTYGAHVLIEALGTEAITQAMEVATAPTTQTTDQTTPRQTQLSEPLRRLLETVLQAHLLEEKAEPVPQYRGIIPWLDRLGRQTIAFKNEVMAWLAFLGAVLEGMVVCFLRPSQWRFTSVVAHIDQTGYQAVPIVFLLNFMVGAVVAFLGATVLEQFGATFFTIHLVGFAFFREFGVLLTAILMAGRTASAFTAHLGSMKLNEEIDALKVGGAEPIRMLVLPRVTALLISLPLLTFIAIVAGVLGGMAVAVLMLDLSYTLFIEVLVDRVGLRHFLVGMSKAPIFAFIIAVTGCHEGFKVKGSAQSLGERTTNSVVKCIFLVILIDALAAMFFMEMGW